MLALILGPISVLVGYGSCGSADVTGSVTTVVISVGGELCDGFGFCAFADSASIGFDTGFFTSGGFRYNTAAVSMGGELCDCFSSGSFANGASKCFDTGFFAGGGFCHNATIILMSQCRTAGCTADSTFFWCGTSCVCVAVTLCRNALSFGPTAGSTSEGLCTGSGARGIFRYRTAIVLVGVCAACGEVINGTVIGFSVYDDHKLILVWCAGQKGVSQFVIYIIPHIHMIVAAETGILTGGLEFLSAIVIQINANLGNSGVVNIQITPTG